ncbi:hypothetical protein H2204_001733 [Knufia peltigerae]|uniref:Uncharacterized protein n=1 Tax=Knufia peltigerae TaxID=1002370 RepID=A0AA38YED7_9EURO|nr:hypothetical protein H2204_001733 [Knufia peltigerae]
MVNLNINQVVLDPHAQVLWKQTIVRLRIVHTGYGPDRLRICYNWNTWLARSGLFSEDIDQKIRNAAQQYIKGRVKEWPVAFRKLGAWTNSEGGVFCRLCGLLEPEWRGGFLVKFTDWALQQSSPAEWNGKLVAPADAYCDEHLCQVIEASRNEQNFSAAEWHVVQPVLDDLTVHMT